MEKRRCSHRRPDILEPHVSVDKLRQHPVSEARRHLPSPPWKEPDISSCI